MLAEINGRQIFYTTVGAGRPMLLMHGGLGLDHTYMRPWLDPLSENAQLIFYDLGGHGRSSRIESYTGVEHDLWVEEADGLREALGFERMILFGQSYGGFLAQEYAIKHGNRLDGLILCSTAPALDYPEVMMGNAQQRATPEQMDALVSGLGSPVVGDEGFRQVWRTILPIYFKRYDPAVGEAMDAATQYSGAAFNHSFHGGMRPFNVLEGLKHVEVPTLILAGREDWITPPAQGAERIHAALPHSKMVVFDESGHFPFIEEQERFLSVVREWLAQL